MCNSIAKMSKLISEVCITVSDVEDYKDGWTENGIRFSFRGGNPLVNSTNNTARCIQHAAGLSKAVEAATNDYILLSDPDIFYHTAVDEIFYNLMKKYGLNTVGVSHPAAITQSFTFFPNVIHCLVKKKDLCDETFLREENHLENNKELKSIRNEIAEISKKIKFLNLTPCAVESKKTMYPNPEGHMECGSNLCLYGIIKNWKWLSFQTTDVHNYTTQYFRSNIKICDKIQRQKLFYHQVGSAGIEHGYLKPFIQLYTEFEMERNDASAHGTNN
jgi:hypothetical protein